MFPRILKQLRQQQPLNLERPDQILLTAKSEREGVGQCFPGEKTPPNDWTSIPLEIFKQRILLKLQEKADCRKGELL